jgi:hypothetical protein
LNNESATEIDYQDPDYPGVPTGEAGIGLPRERTVHGLAEGLAHF